ncbi:MAG: hypothetical protein GXX91_03275, partial [Verrucomicrobiaceae bacterium]|nr:hypothetical protein [Verrucomicrobiaceae bacterium]
RTAQAQAAEKAAARGIGELKKNVEVAAEKVLGNEAEAFRLARSELDKLIEESEAETRRLGDKEASDEAAEEGQATGPTGSDEGERKGGEALAEAEKPQPGTGESKDAEEQKGAKGKGEGKGPGEAQTLAAGEPGEGETPGAGAGEAQDGTGKGEGEAPQQVMRPGKGQRRGGLATGGDDRNGGPPSPGQTAGGPLFFDQDSEQREAGPITGEDYEAWSDRLAEIEEMLPQEDLRNAVGQVRDDARAMRIDFRRDNQPPGAATIQRKITEPLIELRQRLNEEIAKLNRENPVAPIDRDPVPSEFRDLVRRYYEELGAGN